MHGMQQHPFQQWHLTGMNYLVMQAGSYLSKNATLIPR